VVRIIYDFDNWFACKNSLNLSCTAQNSAHKIQIAARLPPFSSSADFGIFTDSSSVYYTAYSKTTLAYRLTSAS
jgi:hypothetical protein